jgi:hypothetical protein
MPVAALIGLGSGSLVRYPGIPRPHRTQRRRRDSNEPQPTDRRSGLFAVSRWRISRFDTQKRRAGEFESVSLQRRVLCEPDSSRLGGSIKIIT